MVYVCACVCVCVLVTQSRLTLYAFRHYYFYIIWPVLTFPLCWFPLPPIFNVIFFLSVDVCMCVCRRRQWHPTPVLLPGKSHGRRSLVGCSPWDHRRVGHDWMTSLSLFTSMHWRRKWQPTPVFLPGESQGRGSLVGCRLWGHTKSDTTKVT